MRGHRRHPFDISVEYQAWPPQLTSDAEGRYGILKGPMSALKVRAEAPGYSQPCRAGAILNGDTTLDVHLVSDTILTASGVPAWDLGFRILRLTESSRRTATNCRPTIESSRRRFWAASIMNTVSKRPREWRDQDKCGGQVEKFSASSSCTRLAAGAASLGLKLPDDDAFLLFHQTQEHDLSQTGQISSTFDADE